MKLSHAQLDTKFHQIVVQQAYIRNDHDKPMTSAEIAEELLNSNGIDGDMLALPPCLLVARTAIDNVDHGPVMIAFCNEIDTIHFKTYRVFF